VEYIIEISQGNDKGISLDGKAIEGNEVSADGKNSYNVKIVV